MSSMRLILALFPTMLVWCQSSLPQSKAGGIRVGAFPEATIQHFAPQRPAEPKRDFPVFDATIFKQKPDLTRDGLKPISMVFKQNLWPQGLDGALLPDRDLVRKAAQASQSTGIAFLDIEHWPTTGAPAVVAENVRKYETLIQWFKEAAPSVKVGYYGVPPVRNYWDALQPANSPRYIGWQKVNGLLASIARFEDVLFPSVYTFYEDQNGWTKYAVEQIRESRRIGGGKPVYIFLWMQYHPSDPKLDGKYLPPDYWRTELETAWKYADGAVIWGGFPGTWDESAAWWQETKKFIQRVGSSGR
jgi:hypothetical protein